MQANDNYTNSASTVFFLFIYITKSKIYKPQPVIF